MYNSDGNKRAQFKHSEAIALVYKLVNVHVFVAYIGSSSL